MGQREYKQIENQGGWKRNKNIKTGNAAYILDHRFR